MNLRHEMRQKLRTKKGNAIKANATAISRLPHHPIQYEVKICG